jgi:heptosyltransferase-2
VDSLFIAAYHSSKNFISGKVIDFKNINKACLYLPNGIGDVICAAPLISALREYKPALHLTIIVKNKTIAELFGGKTRADEIIVYDSGTKTVVRQIQFLFQLRKQHIDLFISDHPGKTALLAWMTGAKISLGDKDSFFSFLFTYSYTTNFSEHKVVNHWKMLEMLGISIKHNPSVYFENEDLIFAEKKIKSICTNTNFIVVHPGCGAWGIHKRWPLKKFEDLIGKIIQHYSINIILVGGNDEMEICNAIAEKLCSENVISLAGQLSIRRLSALLSKAKLAVGNDSGIMHLASACDVRTITLFGPTIAAWCAPFVNNIVVSKNLACSPCYLKTPFGCGNPVCMELIEVNEVYAIVSNELNQIGFRY